MGESVEKTATRHGYDLVATDYAADIGDELSGKPLDRALLDTMVELAAGQTIADIGCGPGHVTLYLANRGARIVGLDLSPVMCALGRRATSLPFASADMTALPVRSRGLGAIVSLYAVIHLDDAGRVAAYREFARTLRPGGHALIAFHTHDENTSPGGVQTLTDWWGHDVLLNFRFLDPLQEVESLAAVGLQLIARLDRAPYDGAEHASHRSYLLLRRVAEHSGQMFDKLL